MKRVVSGDGSVVSYTLLVLVLVIDVVFFLHAVGNNAHNYIRPDNLTAA